MFIDLRHLVETRQAKQGQALPVLVEARGHRNFSAMSTTTTEDGSQSPCSLLSSCRRDNLQISAVILTVSLLAFLENLALLVAVLHWKLGKSCRMFWFLWHLSLADAVVALSFAYFHIRLLTSCASPPGCLVQHPAESAVLLILFFSTICASHLFVLSATVDRFIAIKWSLRYTKIVTTRSTRVVAACVWVGSFIFPMFGGLGTLLWRRDLAYSVATLACATLCLLAAACVIVLNLWLVHYAWTSIRSAPTLSVQARGRPSTTSSFPDLSAYHDSVKLIITLALFVGSFLLSCAPWSVALIVCEEAHSCVAKKDQDYTLVLVLFHAIVIPVLYGFRVEEVKRRVIRFWKNLLPRERLRRCVCCS